MDKFNEDFKFKRGDVLKAQPLNEIVDTVNEIIDNFANYSPVGHQHPEYAPVGHQHVDEHGEPIFAPIGHQHDYSDIFSSKTHDHIGSQGEAEYSPEGHQHAEYISNRVTIIPVTQSEYDGLTPEEKADTTKLYDIVTSKSRALTIVGDVTKIIVGDNEYTPTGNQIIIPGTTVFHESLEFSLQPNEVEDPEVPEGPEDSHQDGGTEISGGTL